MRRFTLLLCLLVAPAAAQNAPGRNYALLQDSLKQSTNAAELRRREVALGSGERARTLDGLMERGLVLIRLFELEKKNKDADHARESFEKAIEREPLFAWAYYAHGVSLAGGPDVRVPSPFGVLDGFVLGQSLAELTGRDPLTRAARQFIRAAELDPMLTEAGVLAARIALQTRNRELLRRTRDVLTDMVNAGQRTGEAPVALARVQSALGEVGSAEATAGAMGEEATGSAWRTRAEALLRQDGKADAGAEAYFQGLDKLDETSASEYFEDLRIVATDQEIAAWAAVPLDGRREWLRRFWDMRAASSGKTVADRLSEHYRRLSVAQERYRKLSKRGAAPGGALLSEKYDPDRLPFDERGLIYVRHGEPENIVRTANVDLRPNETWVYQLPTGRTQLYHFVALRDGGDFRLVDDILHAMDATQEGLPFDGVAKLLEDRQGYDARYSLLAQRFNQIRNQRWAASAFTAFCQAQGGTGCARDANAALGEAANMLQTIATTRQSIANENREAAYRALDSDSDRPEFAQPLPFYYDVYSFKGNGEKTDLTAAIAVPGTSLTARPNGNRYLYSVKLSLIVIDTTSGTITRRDTTYQFGSGRILGENEHVRIHADLPTSASKSTIHRVVISDQNNAGRGQMYGGSTAVPEYRSTGLMISNIVLAEPEAGSWRRGDTRLALVPPRQFMEGAQLSLFYELYNLPRDTPYRTEISLAPSTEQSGFARLKRLFGGSDGTLRLQFDGVASVDRNGNVQELRKVGTELKPGKYKVQIKVTNLTSNQVATNETQFVVVERK